MWMAPCWELEAAAVVMVDLGAAGLEAEKSSAMKGLLVATPTPTRTGVAQLGLSPDQRRQQYQEEVSGGLQ